ncbi:hypothetical protein OC861_001470 [Tilletia horrida]|nr:hypothetical protein OC861_001470 [Tilletia horrida]
MAHVNERTPLLGGSSQPNDERHQNPRPRSSTPLRTDANGHVLEMPPASFLAPILASVWVPVFVASLDGTIVATLVSSISSEFGHSEQSAWLGTAYLLSFAAFSPIYARLCDFIGRKTSMMVALTFFTVGTLCCGLSKSMNALLVSRAIAGIGGGGIPTITSVIMSDLVPLRNRGLLQGWTNLVYGAAAALGGPLGGFMNDRTGWRFAFLVQIPLLVVAYFSILKFVPSAPRKKIEAEQLPSADSSADANPAVSHATRIASFLRFLVDIDLPGVIFLISSIVTILMAVSFMSANDLELRDPKVVSLLAVGLFSVVSFILTEWRCGRREQHGAKPVLPLRLLATRTGAGVAFSNFFLFPLFFQTVLLKSASVAGLHLIPNSVGLSMGSVFAGWYMRKTGRFYWLNLSNAIVMTLASLAVLNLSEKTPTWWTYAAIFPNGFGVAAVLTCTLIAAINDVQYKDVAVMTGMTYLFRSNAQVLGVALSGVLLQTVLKEQLRDRITGPGAEEIISKIRHQASIVPTLSPELQRAAIESYRVALRAVFLCTTITGVLVIVFCAIIGDVPLPEHAKANEDEEEVGEQEA